MRLRGLSWNVHRGQLLHIRRISQPRKPWAGCPSAQPPQHGRSRTFFHVVPQKKWQAVRDRGGFGHRGNSTLLGILSQSQAGECQEQYQYNFSHSTSGTNVISNDWELVEPTDSSRK